jgi:hypothetical protein
VSFVRQAKAILPLDGSDSLTELTPEQRILELEVRSGTTLDASQNLRTLKFDKWQPEQWEFAKSKPTAQIAHDTPLRE